MKETMNELVEQITYYNNEYRNGNPVVSDAEYDALVDRLKSMNPDHEWFQKIEPVNVPEGRKEKLPHQMKSLDKVKNMNDLFKWLKKFGFGQMTEVVIMPKYDGCSLLCDEVDNKAWSRGGEENEGMSCHSHLSKMKTILSPESFRLTMGEAIFSKKNWENHFAGKINPRSGQPYKSARNTVSGLLRQDIAPDEMQYVDFIRYGVDGNSTDYTQFSDLLCDLSKIYNQPSIFCVKKIYQITELVLADLYRMWSNEYEIDGLVIYINDIMFWNTIGRHKTSGNPQWAIAYKGNFEGVFETEVKGLFIRVSKDGSLKPTVEFSPIELPSATISEATGNNLRWIQDMEIAPGARILVKRSGEVIPKIESVIQPAPAERFQEMWDELATCPVCDEPTSWKESGVDMVCKNKDCLGIKHAKALHFFTTIGCFGVGPETLAYIVKGGFVEIEDIMSMSLSDMIGKCKLGPSVSSTMMGVINKIKEGVPAVVLMHASDCFEGIGQSKAMDILNSLSDEQLGRFNNLELLSVSGDGITICNFNNGYLKFIEFISNTPSITMIPYIKPEEKQRVDGPLSECRVCFSGVRDKSLEADICSLGGAIATGVSKAVTHLIVKDTEASSSKITKAKSLGIKVCNIKDFIDFVNSYK